jgi:phage terminase large subunit-like protein
MGKVKIPKSKPWMADVMAQWLQFPAGRVDDAVDAASLIGRGLEFTRSATRKDPIRYPSLAIP